VSDTFSVREATAGDLETLVAFNAAMARETEHRDLDLEVLRAGVRNLLVDPSRGVYLVLEEAGRVLAALMLTREWSDWRNGEFWWIQSVYVRPEARRRGCYRRLYEVVRARAADAPGVCGLRLYVERDNAVAQRTYAALGMSETAYLLYEVESERAALRRGD
jgi:ribosomal protein S18 acetylase RimI-like enzyme